MARCRRFVSPSVDTPISVGDTVKLHGTVTTSTVKRLFSDGMLFLVHANNSNGTYRRDRVESVSTEVSMVPSMAMSYQQTMNFLHLTLSLTNLLRHPDSAMAHRWQTRMMERFDAPDSAPINSSRFDGLIDIAQKGSWAQLWNDENVKILGEQITWNELSLLCSMKIQPQVYPSRI